jgi:hypothetical protein
MNVLPAPYDGYYYIGGQTLILYHIASNDFIFYQDKVQTAPSIVIRKPTTPSTITMLSGISGELTVDVHQMTSGKSDLPTYSITGGCETDCKTCDLVTPFNTIGKCFNCTSGSTKFARPDGNCYATCDAPLFGAATWGSCVADLDCPINTSPNTATRTCTTPCAAPNSGLHPTTGLCTTC